MRVMLGPARYYGEERIKRKFAILPCCAAREIRWLEPVVIKQCWWDNQWNNVEFIDKKGKA